MTNPNDTVSRRAVLVELTKHAKGSTVIGGQTFRTIQLGEAATAVMAIPAVAASQPADPVTNADSRQRVVVNEGPQPRGTKTCKGCLHFKSEYWREPSGDGETFDSGTSADCTKANRSISTYLGDEPHVPEWCPVAAIDVHPDLRDAQIAALVEALALAANRLQRCAVDYDTGSREFIETSEWAKEARAAVKGGDA